MADRTPPGRRDVRPDIGFPARSVAGPEFTRSLETGTERRSRQERQGPGPEAEG
jgi:hypothetical protein